MNSAGCEPQSQLQQSQLQQQQHNERPSALSNYGPI